ncbi:DUF6544 family protein [Sulfurimonas sp.]|uniref:DUF6920 family protein n=1 Tax=Sulfurimonas sp. TaxID=2022749 RepID=UPI00356A9EF5
MFVLKTTIILSVLALLAFFVLQISWLNFTSSASKDLFTNASNEKKLVNFEELNTLPKPVQKYFHLVLKDKSAIINRAYVSQVGEFRMDENSEKFSKTEAQQFFSTKPKGFTWHAKISIDAGIYVNVFDSYIDSKAGIKAKFLSVYTVVDQFEKKELNEAALQRYLAEAIWYPTALLPSQGVKWTSIDANTAKATITDGDTTTSLEFSFNEKGEISSIYSPNRFRGVDDHYIATPWSCKVSNYVQKDHYLIPQYGEVSWLINNKEFTYYKLNIQDVQYN